MGISLDFATNGKTTIRFISSNLNRRFSKNSVGATDAPHE
jgi:hypothetical protein